MAHQVKNPPAMQETQETPVGFLVWEDPLDQMAPGAISLPGKSRGQRSLVGYSPKDHKDTTEHARVS